MKCPEKFLFHAPGWYAHATDQAWLSRSLNEPVSKTRVVRLDGRRAYHFKELIEKGYTWSIDEGKTWHKFENP